MGKKKNEDANDKNQFSAEISADLTLDPIVCRGPCKKQFPRNSFLKHILQAKKCTHLYKAEELDLIKSQNSAQSKKKNEKQKASKTKKVSKQKQPAVNDDTTNTNQDIIFCKGPCGKKFPRNTFLKHVMRVKKCKGMYTEKELNSLKKVAKQIDQKRQDEKKNAIYQATKEEGLKSSTQESRILNFRHDCQYGPIFTCICCMRDLFKRSVRVVTNEYEAFLEGSEMKSYLQIEEVGSTKVFQKTLQVHDSYHLCRNCCRYLEKLEMPPICAKNALEYAKIPDCLALNNLERQLICRDLIFLKIRELYKTGMKKINDRVINVPLDDDEIIKTVTSLPRSKKNHGLIIVGLKRDEIYQDFHILDMIDPKKVFEGLNYLIENHPQYCNINVHSLEEWSLQYFNKEDENTHVDETNLCNDETEDSPYNFSTCLLPEAPLNDVKGT